MEKHASETRSGRSRVEASRPRRDEVLQRLGELPFGSLKDIKAYYRHEKKLLPKKIRASGFLIKYKDVIPESE